MTLSQFGNKDVGSPGSDFSLVHDWALCDTNIVISLDEDCNCWIILETVARHSFNKGSVPIFDHNEQNATSSLLPAFEKKLKSA